MNNVCVIQYSGTAILDHQGRIQKFFEGGILKFFVWTGKFRGGFGIFFLKNPSKLKKIFSKRGGGLIPKTPPEYAPVDHTEQVINGIN